MKDEQTDAQTDEDFHVSCETESLLSGGGGGVKT